MNKAFGAFNSRGFSSSVSSGAFPKESHLTYEGVFNELKYNVGKPTAKPVDLHFGYARYQFPHSVHDQGINDFLAVFLKGESDGKDRDARRLNAVLCLDISGSMDGPLERNNQGKQQSRLALSREAIKMFVSKLRADDAVGIVLFDTEAETFLPLTIKKDIPQSLYTDIDGIKTRGGTTIRIGLQQSTLEMKKWLSQGSLQNCQNRIIMMTDVGDNSIQGEKAFIELASQESNINLTIVGVSNDFQSHVCESLKDIRGFNYFCAVNQCDIKKYIFQQFDFNFFPSVYNLQISISSEDIHSFEVYGVPDADKVKQYNGSFQQPRESYVVTKVKSSFPSDIQIHADSVFTYGGLILLKLKRNSKEGFFKAKIKVTYESPDGSKLVDQYAAGFEFHQQEQFFSQESLRQAVEGFIFVSEVKQLLAEGKTEEGKKHIYERYWKTLEQLQKFTPKSKLQDLKNIIKIVEKLKPASQTAEK